MNEKICDCPSGVKARCSCKMCGKELFDGFRRYSMIMASAGTGKTYNLAMRYLQLISFGVDPSEILAVTFTRKAAGEIFDKIITRVIAIIKENTCCTVSNKAKFISILKKLLCPENELRISTIDSFLSSLVKIYSPELGISGELTMIDSNDDRIKKKVLRKWLAESDEKEELRELIKNANNGKQINFEASMCDIIDDIYAFYLGVLFDNGKGKTEWGKPFAFEDKLEDFSSDELEKIKDYLSVFSNTRSKAIVERTTSLTKFITDPQRGDIPDLVEKLLKNFVDNNEGEWLFENGLPLKYSATIEFPADAADYYRKALRFILKIVITRCRTKTKAVHSLVKKFDELYNRDVRSKGMLSFDDLKVMLRNSGENETFHLKSSEEMNMEERLDSTLNHYLFDEFQDTSNNDWYIFENLINEILSADDDRFRSVFCVGDIKQSIYQWRGADPALFGKVIKSAEVAANNRGYTPLKALYESYRSSQDVLDTVNTFFETKNLPGFFPHAFERMAYAKHVSKKKDFPGYSSLIDVSIEENPMRAKAEIIAGVLRQISPFSRSKKLTVGVLMQKNKDCTDLAEHLSSFIDLPISIDGKISPQNSMAFNVLRQMIMLSEHPGDGTARGFLEMLNIGGIHYLPSELAEKFGWILSEDADYDKLAKQIKSDIFKNGLDGFIQHFLNVFGPQLDQFDFDRIEAARTLAESFTGTPDEYLHAIDTWHELNDQSVASTIQFMTIHKSKGLEFDVVFLPQMKSSPAEVHGKHETAYPEEAINRVRWINYFPNKIFCKMIPELSKHRKLKNRERVFEECCKFYVAMTRAKRAMYIFTETDKVNASPEDITFEEMMTQVLAANYTNTEEVERPYKLLYSTGIENWYDLLKADPEISPKEIQPETTPVFIKTKRKRFLASHQHKFHVVPEYRFSAGSAAATGTVLHDLFEKIDYVDNSFSAEEFLNQENITDQQIRELFITATAESSELRSALKKPAEPHILWKERRFLLKGDNGELIPGAFDRVVITLDDAGNMSKAEILDYKSDNVKTAKELTDRHRAQLELYRSCLSRMTGIPQENITIKLAALRMGKIIEIA